MSLTYVESMLLSMSDPDPDISLVTARERRLAGMEPPHLDPGLDRVRRGYYRPASADLTTSQHYRLRIQAAADARQGSLVFSHAAAAELWGCPLLATDTRLVHATQPGKARKTTAGTQIHRCAVREQHVVTHPSGLLVTSREWTAVQVAAALVLPNALLPLDHLVRVLNQDADGDPTGRAVVDRLIALIPPQMKGGARAERNLRLANALSGSAGESLSRGQMALLEVPMPDLQVPFARRDVPGDDIVDFDWPELGTFGEFDGKGKYFREELTDGRTADEVLWDEKTREDRVRRHRPRAARWGWDVAMSRQRLARTLAAAGVHARRR